MTNPALGLNADLLFNPHVWPVSCIDKVLMEVAKLAKRIHDGQFRKDKHTEYIVHPLQVACGLVNVGCKDIIILSAAMLHDAIEDGNITPQELYKRLVDIQIDHEGAACIVKLVLELTNINKQGYDQFSLNRKRKKEVVLSLIEYASAEACIIKIYDRINNLSTISAVESGDFVSIYKQESYKLFRAIEERLKKFVETELIARAIIDMKVICKNLP